MPRHYVKISRRLRPYAAKVAKLGDDWRRMIFDDITRGGREIRAVPVAANEQGPLIGLCGEVFFCHAGQDKHNAYSLFISRIGRADTCPPDQTPVEIAGNFELITESDRDLSPLEPVRPLFVQLGAVPASEPAHAPSSPTSALLHVLAAADSHLRQRWADDLPAPENGGDIELLKTLKRLWQRYGLERFSEPAPRPLALLQGRITPSQLSITDCRDVATAFGVTALNAMAEEQLKTGASTQQVLDLLDDLASLPLDPDVRAEIRGALAKAASGADVDSGGSEAVTQWILRQCGVERADLEGHVQALTAAVHDWQAHAHSLESAGDVLAFARSLDTLAERVREAAGALPAAEDIAARKRHAEVAYMRALGLLGDSTVHLIEREPELTADALVEIAELSAMPDALDALPAWLWSGVADPPESADTAYQTARARALVEPELRALLLRARSLVRGLDPAVHELVARYPAPPPGTSAEAHFERAVAELGEIARELSPNCQVHLAWMQAALGQGWSVAQVIEVAKGLGSLGRRLGDEAFSELIADFTAWTGDPDSASAPAAQARVEAYKGAVARIEEIFGNAQDATWSQVARLVERHVASQPEPPQPGPESAAPVGPVLRLDDNRVDETGRRMPLVLVPHEDQERPYGVVSVPMTVRTSQARDMDFDLEVDVQSSLHDSWPASWDRPGPETLRIAASEWRRQGDDAIYTFALEVPLRPPKTGRETVEITVRAVDPHTGLPLSDKKRLRWRQISTWEGELPFAWPDTVRPEYVHEHPIGPQERYADIVQRLQNGGSFAVIAPRRFGKTTLVEYLHRCADDLGLAIAPPVVCTSVMNERGLDYNELWKRVSAGLARCLGGGVGIRVTPDAPLPDEDAFDAVREVAWRQGRRAVVVLFDEAQLLFPRKSGDRLGDQFKDRIERHWSRTDMADKVPVVFGFIGLPGLRERAGANFMGILRPYEGRHIEERALNRLLLQITRGRMSTTREARQRLAAQSGNLYTLKTLLDRLIRYINRKRRTWAALQDVLAVEREIRVELERGADHNLSQYMRDPLNQSEDINAWKPRACFPVAVAMAVHGDKTGEARTDAALATLHDWCRSLKDDSGRALVFTKSRVEEHLATLTDLGLWNGVGFVSEIFRSWLVGVAHSFPRTEADRQVLTRAALERIRMPHDLELVAGNSIGGLYRFSRTGVDYALRKVILATEAQQQRFVERARALEIIRQRQHRRDAGAEYIYNLMSVGLAEGEDIGVEIYQWIDGATLEDKVGQLDPVLVADLGSKLAMALRLLHAHDILHEDICPRNIILERASMRPILIDFGVARTRGDRVPGQGSSELIAPEVRRGDTPWTKAADVYALGATLTALWNRDRARSEEAEPLDELLRACTRETPEERIDAEELVRRTDTVSETLRVYQRQEQAWRELEEVARADLDKRWFRELMDKFRPRFVAILSGMQTDVFERCCEVALFLDQVLEAAHADSPSVLNLGRVKHHNEDTGDMLIAPSIALLHALRLNVAHYRQNQSRARLEQRFGIGDESRLRELVIEGARLIASVVSLSSLPTITEIVLRGE